MRLPLLPFLSVLLATFVGSMGCAAPTEATNDEDVDVETTESNLDAAAVVGKWQVGEAKIACPSCGYAFSSLALAADGTFQADVFDAAFNGTWTQRGSQLTLKSSDGRAPKALLRRYVATLSADRRSLAIALGGMTTTFERLRDAPNDDPFDAASCDGPFNLRKFNEGRSWRKLPSGEMTFLANPIKLSRRFVGCKSAACTEVENLGALRVWSRPSRGLWFTVEAEGQTQGTRWGAYLSLAGAGGSPTPAQTGCAPHVQGTVSWWPATQASESRAWLSGTCAPPSSGGVSSSGKYLSLRAYVTNHCVRLVGQGPGTEAAAVVRF